MSLKKHFRINCIFIITLFLLIIGCSLIIKNDNSMNTFTVILVTFIFISQVLYISKVIYEDSPKFRQVPYVLGNIIFSPALIGLMHYLNRRKPYIKCYKKEVRKLFKLNMFSASISSILVLLFLNNLLNFLPKSLTYIINTLIIILAAVFFILSLISIFKLRNVNHGSDKLIKRLQVPILFINLIPIIMAIFIVK